MKSVALCVVSALVIAGCGRKAETRDRLVELAEYSAFHDITTIDNPALEAASHAIVKISDSSGSGTGFFVDGTGKLVTNNHVVGVKTCPRSGCFITINVDYQVGKEFKAGEEVFAVPLVVDTMLDVSVLQLYQADQKSQLGSPAFLSLTNDTGATLNGVEVFSIGHPGGGVKKWSSGSVIYYYGDWIEADFFAMPGTSGSPVLNATGQVVGLNHRIVGSVRSITEDSYQQTAYFSASGAVANVIAGNTAGLALLDSQSMPSRADVAKEEEAFYNAHLGKVKVQAAAEPAAAAAGPTETSVLETLGEACDAGLAETAFQDPDEFDASLTACRAAMKWISCVPKDLSDAPYKRCPVGEERQGWEARFVKKSDKFRGFWVNNIDYDSARTPTLFIADKDAKKAARQDAFKAELDRVAPPMNPGLAGEIYSRLALSHYGGVAITEYLKNYEDIPHYNRYAYDIFFGLYSMHKDGIMSADDLIFELKSLIYDGSVPLGDKLDLEAIAYEMGLL